MKFNRLFLVMLLAFSCGGEVENIKVKSKILLDKSDSGNSPVRGNMNLDFNVREIVAVTLPNAEDIAPTYAEDDSEKLKSYFSHLDGYKDFHQPITKGMSAEEKADEIAAKVMVLGKVRDSLWEKMDGAKKELAALEKVQAEIAETHKDEITRLNADLQCHIVKSSYGVNANKCYLKALDGRKTRSPKAFIEDTEKPCTFRYSDWKERYAGYEADPNIPAAELGQYQLSSEKYEALLESPVVAKCGTLSSQLKDLEEKISKWDSLRAELKGYVGSFLAGINEVSTLSRENQPKYFFLAVTKTDVKTDLWGNKPNPYDLEWNSENPDNLCIEKCVETKSIVEFDLQNKTFGKFQLALQMKEQNASAEDTEGLLDDENPLNEYTIVSSGQGMSDVRLEKVGEGDFDYVLRFSLTGPNFNLTTHEDGLELSVSPIYGARFSGKTVVRYLDGTVRNGVFRIDLDIKK
tara:strand:- start:22625 stop:24013 length:1389 start_codon:yes stop_codon:yes gene_type:complete